MTVQLSSAQHLVVFQLRLKHVRLSVNVSVSLIDWQSIQGIRIDLAVF